MRSVDGELRFSPTDLVNHLYCAHLSGLNRERACGRAQPPPYRDEAAELVAKHGDLHERRYLERLLAEGNEVAEIDAFSPDAAAETARALRAGAEVVFQATFDAGAWSGHADFLVRVERPSGLGDFSYEVYDTKLARTEKVTALVQLAEYSQQLAAIQGVVPERVHLVLGDNTVSTFALDEIAPFHRAVKRQFAADLDTDLLGRYPEPVEHCSRCVWRSQCRQRRVDDDHLTLVADLGRGQAGRLETAGIATVEALAATDVDRVKGMTRHTFERLKDQARLQVDARATGANSYEFLEPGGAGFGLEALPPPSEGDLFFDIESDPFLGDGGLEYLFGHVDTDSEYVQHWAVGLDEEKRQTERFIDDITERLAVDRAMHVYHFGHYEPTALKRLTCRHGTREIELDDLLRAGVFVDLHRVVKQGLRASIDSYSIKRLEVFYMDARTTEVASGIDSAVAFEVWLAQPDRSDRGELDKIAAYNRDDCESTLLLRGWLEELRGELETEIGRPLERPDPGSRERSEEAEQIEAEVAELQECLLDGVAEDPGDRTAEQDARWILAHLLLWHRREERSDWWAYFDRRDLDDEDRYDHNECIAGLTFIETVGQRGGMAVHRYGFDPSQEIKFGPNAVLMDPVTERSPGTVHVLDLRAGIVEFRRRTSNIKAHPSSVMVANPHLGDAPRTALRRLARQVADTGVDRLSESNAALRLLLRRPPDRQDTSQPDDDTTRQAIQRALACDYDYLAVQGPPGSGKTYIGARVIAALIDAGQTVGITANSHKVIDHLLAEVIDIRPSTRAIKKTGMSTNDIAGVESTGNNSRVVAALDDGGIDLVAGTTYLMAREEMAGRLDTLVVDEAAQLSLANAIAAAQAAHNLVLLGDPQQLDQPAKAAHPPGTDTSALGHLLSEHQTIPAELGIFLPLTRRMHPNVCAFISEEFYDDKLSSHPACELQHFSELATGVQLRLVDHDGRKSASPEEADTVHQLVGEIVGQTWTDQAGNTRTLGLDDILVVTPYNAQVRRLVDTIGADARIGTVDLFQGQEAPVVIYSMAASSAELAPRGIDFLYDLHRLNVAISRAQGAAIIVCSPQLIPPPCHNVSQLPAVSALCRYEELASADGP